MEQLLLHLFGDYVTQTDWMAREKTRSNWAAFVHATIYALPFLWIGSIAAVAVIWSTHLVIDRFGLARYVVFAKNKLTAPGMRWRDSSATGFPSSVPVGQATLLLMIVDNTMHLGINYLALGWL